MQLSDTKPFDFYSHNVEISEHGEVFFNDKRVQQTADFKVSLPDVNDGRPILVATLMIYAFRACLLPVQFIDSILPLFKDNDASNLTASNIEYRYTYPLEHPEYKGFFFIPYFNRYLVNREGQIFSLQRRRLLSTHERVGDKVRSNTTYVFTDVVSDFGKQTSIAVHRLIGFTFLHYEADVFSLQINHKDGKGTNNSVMNLEWVTPRENLEHSYENNLNLKRKPIAVLSKCIATGKIVSYWNLHVAAEALGYSGIAGLVRRLNQPGRVYSDGLVLKRDDDTPWPEISQECGVRAMDKGVRIVCINVFTGRKVIAGTSVEAGSVCGCSQMAAHKAITASRLLPLKGWVLIGADKFKDTEIPTFNKWDMQIFRECLDRLPNYVYVVQKGTVKSLVMKSSLVVEQTGLNIEQVKESALTGRQYQDTIIYRYYPTGCKLVKEGNLYTGELF